MVIEEGSAAIAKPRRSSGARIYPPFRPSLRHVQLRDSQDFRVPFPELLHLAPAAAFEKAAYRRRTVRLRNVS